MNSKEELDILDEINYLRKKSNAIILAHYYQTPEIQELADFIGDSLELSRKAAENDADVIVFCGVHFMAETAKILSPEKTVLIPDIEAGCSLADDCPEEDFIKFKKENPNHFVISYINCSAAVKSHSDLICTSSNAVNLVNQLPKDRQIIFAPDQNLGRWVESQSGRKLKLWPGSCQVHETFSEEEVLKLKIKHTGAEVIAHPECIPSLLSLSNFIGSTSKLLEYINKKECSEFIVLTEPGIIHQMQKIQPNKLFIEVPDIFGCSCNECPYMRLNTIEKIRDCLKNKNPSIELDETMRRKAYIPIKKMLEMS